MLIHVVQLHHKGSCGSVREKRGNTVKFKSSAREMNHIVQKDVSTVLSKKVKTKINRDPEIASSDTKGLIYLIHHIKLFKASNDFDSDSNLLLAHHR